MSTRITSDYYDGLPILVAQALAADGGWTAWPKDDDDVVLFEGIVEYADVDDLVLYPDSDPAAGVTIAWDLINTLDL